MFGEKIEKSTQHFFTTLNMWENQVLLMDGQVVFPRVLRFSPTFDEKLARYK